MIINESLFLHYTKPFVNIITLIGATSNYLKELQKQIPLKHYDEIQILWIQYSTGFQVIELPEIKQLHTPLLPIQLCHSTFINSIK